MTRRFAHVAVFALVSGLLALGVWLAGRSLDPEAAVTLDGDARDPGSRAMHVFPFGKYERLAICVQATTGAPDDARYTRQQVRAGLAAFAGVAAFQDAGVRLAYRFPPLVDIGCPTAPARLQVARTPKQVAAGSTDALPHPSPDWLHVFVVPENDLGRVERGAVWSQSAPTVEEVTPPEPGGVAFPVTRGTYVTVAELGDIGSVEAFLNRTFRLTRRVP
ncbi:MAG: hypothetical protein IT305_17315 [Chloroflexi bacterium]|nr:hypothetical protein [Chloroflexota bacterium]